MHISKGETRMISVSDLKVDDIYQRDAALWHVNRISAGFEGEAFGFLLVGERKDGSLWVVDGFQRLSSAKKQGVNKVPCEVFQSEGRAHEARMFRLRNTKKTMTRHELFKGLVAEGNEEAAAVYKAIVEAGLNVAGMKSDIRGHAIRGVKACVDAYKRGGFEHLREVLRLLRTVWRDYPETAFHCAVIGGLSVFLHRFGEQVDRKKLSGKLEQMSPNKVMGSAEPFKLMSGTTRDEGVGRAFLLVYNRCLHKKLDWDRSRADQKKVKKTSGESA